MPPSNILSKISRTKCLDSFDLVTDFKRCLTTSDLFLLGIGNMVGSGLYVLTGEVARKTAGPSVVVSYILAGLMSLMSAICYAEFGARIPITGSAFIYTYVTMGEIWAFLIGWNLILEYIVAAAAAASAWGGCIDQLLDNQIKNTTIHFILNGKPWESDVLARYPNFIGFGIICALLVLVCMGVSCSSVTMNFSVCLNVLIVSVIFILSMTKADISNWSSGNGFFAFGISGVLAGSATCFFAFVGFDVIALATEEALTPDRSMPIASVSSVVFVMCLYALASIALTLMVPYYEIVPEAAYPIALKTIGYKWAEILVGIGTLIGMTSSILGSLFALPRSVYAMANEGLIFPCFALISKRTKIPIISTFVFGGLAALLALLFELSALVEFLSIGTLMAYAIVAAAVIIIRYQPATGNTMDKESALNSSAPVKRDRYGTLKDPFKDLPIIKGLPPGRAVYICYFASVVFQFLSMAIAIKMSDFFGKWWTLILATTLGFFAILTFIPVPLHHQNQDRTTFKVPFVPYFPALSVFLNIVLMMNLELLTWIRFFIWITIGLIIYVLYGYHHSLEGIKRNGSNDYQRMSNDPKSIAYGAIQLQAATTKLH
ncbi:cationic amino acid transporter 4-like [Anneissia japonica]|uniref:cationic amino acid transporter 4-like n=1 Tax=Anneissia japonica TaxID=1529436 RepID=UPI0014255A00|nr:cationic amino acid transporter 4-like [Anneissia japonica]